MLRIRPGRSWRHNPSYLEELRSLSRPAARAYTGVGLLDALGIEVDGVDIAAGAGEAPIVAALEELGEALVRIGSGEPAAQASIGVGPALLLLEPHGEEVRLTLVSLRQPARVLVQDLLVDGLRMRKAAHAAIQGLLGDLVGLCPALEEAPLSRRLLRLCAALAARPNRAPKPWLRRRATGKPLRLGPLRVGDQGLILDLHLPLEACDALASAKGVPWAPLLPLLWRGALTLGPRGGPKLLWEGAPFLALRALVADAHELVRAWESGDEERPLRFGNAALHLRLREGLVHADGWKAAVPATAPRFAEAVGSLARSFASRALRLSGLPAWPLLQDLASSARDLVEHARALASGDLQRQPSSVRSPPTRRVDPRPAAPGQVRRLVLRQTFAGQAGQAGHALLVTAESGGEPGAGVCVVGGPGRLIALDLLEGRLRWSLETQRSWPAAVRRIPQSQELLVVESRSVARLDPVSGEVRWRRRTASPVTGSWPFARATVLALADGSTAALDEQGSLLFRLERCATRHALLEGGVLLLHLATERLRAVDGLCGDRLWESGPQPRLLDWVSSGQSLWSLCEPAPGTRALASFASSTGESETHTALPGHFDAAIPATLVLGADPAGPRGDLLVTPGATGAWVQHKPGGLRALDLGGALRGLWALDQPEGAEPACVGLCESGELVRFSREVLTARLTPPRADLPAVSLASEALLVGSTLVDPLQGRVLATLPGPAPVEAVLGPNLGLAVRLPNGAFALHRVASRFSLV